MDLPKELSSIQAFVGRANELESVMPIVCFYLREYAADAALSVHKKDPHNDSVKAFVIGLLDWLEANKHVRMDDDEEAQKMILDYGLRLIVEANKTDVAGKASIRIAK
jgi:hypothetical protein